MADKKVYINKPQRLTKSVSMQLQIFNVFNKFCMLAVFSGCYGLQVCLERYIMSLRVMPSSTIGSG